MSFILMKLRTDIGYALNIFEVIQHPGGSGDGGSNRSPGTETNLDFSNNVATVWL